MRFISPLTVLSVLTSCSAQAQSPDPHPTSQLLIPETHWRITHVGDKVLPDDGVHGIHLTEPHRLWLHDGCQEQPGQWMSPGPDGITRIDSQTDANWSHKPVIPQDCKSDPAQMMIYKAYERLLGRPASLEHFEDDTQDVISVTPLNLPYAIGPSLPGPRPEKPALKLARVDVTDMSSIEGKQLYILDSTDHWRPIDHYPPLPRPVWIQFEDNMVWGTDGCNPLAAHIRPTESGVSTKRINIIPHAKCSTLPDAESRRAAIELVLAGSNRVNVKKAKIQIEAGGRFAIFTPSNSASVDFITTWFDVGSHWRLAELDGKAVSLDGEQGFRIDENSDSRALGVMNDGCGSEQFRLWFGNGRLAFTNTNRDPSGFNQASHTKCVNLGIKDPRADQATQDAYNVLMDRSWQATRSGDDIILEWKGSDSQKINGKLTRDSVIDLSAILNKRLVLMEATGLPPRAKWAAEDNYFPHRSQPHLTFTVGNFGGYDGCNGFGGDYRLINNTIIMGMITANAMGCGGLANKLRKAVYRALSKDMKISISGNQVMFTTKDGFSTFEIQDIPAAQQE